MVIKDENKPEKHKPKEIDEEVIYTEIIYDEDKYKDYTKSIYLNQKNTVYSIL